MQPHAGTRYVVVEAAKHLEQLGAVTLQINTQAVIGDG
jgi:hypothetical protein